MTGAQTPPANFLNCGTVLDATLIRPSSPTKTGANFTLTIQGYAGHDYQSQTTETPGGRWTNIGPVQAGSGGVLTFNDLGGATGERKFHRVLVAP